MLRRPLTVGVTAAALVAVSVPAAYAAWIVSGQGAGTASARSLAPATSPNASASGQNVTINWTNGSNPDGTNYEVTRNSPTPLTFDCSASPCLDNGAPAGTYTYSVAPRLQKWSGAAASTGDITVGSAASATKLSLSAAPSSFTAGTSTTVTVTAQKADNSTDTAFAGSRSVTWGGTVFVNGPTSGTPSGPANVTFVDGVASATVTLVRAGSGTLTGTVSGLTSGSTPVTVVPAQTRLTFVQSSSHNACANGGTLTLGSGNKNWAAPVSRGVDIYGNQALTTAGVTVTVERVGQNQAATTASIGVDQSQSSLISPMTNIQNNTTQVVVTATAPGFDSVTCTLTH